MEKRVLYQIGGDDKVPEGTKRVYTYYDFLKEIGWLHAMEKEGFIINPTHNFELLKETRIEKKYKPALQAFLDDFKKKVGKDPDEYDIKFFYNEWLKKELEIAKDWLINAKRAVNKRQISKYIDWVNNELTKETISKDGTPPKKYIANEYALTYIFDLYAIGQQVPINRIEGSFDAKKIKQDASKFLTYDKAPDTFYRAVKSVLEYDLNKPTDLQNISKDWLNAVRNLSTNWAKTEQYLKDKNLIGE
jgi:hypothetical protein